MRPLAVACFFAMVELMPGCNQQLGKNYDLAIKSGVEGQSYPGEFNRLFPGAENIISYYSGELGPTAWTSTVGMYGRYVLRMQCRIELNHNRDKIVSAGTPNLYLYEFTAITPRGNEAYSIACRQVTTFSVDKWHRLVEATGDFRALGITLETNKPVPWFEKAWSRF